MLFKPHFDDMEYDEIDRTSFNSIMKCDIDVRKDFYPNIVLSGDSTMYVGLPGIIDKEVIALAPATMKIRLLNQKIENMPFGLDAQF
jgi:actin-related protein